MGGFVEMKVRSRKIFKACQHNRQIHCTMSDIYQNTLTTQTGETFTGMMSRRQPELINDFVPMATETG